MMSSYEDPKVRRAIQAHLAASELRKALSSYRHHYSDGVTNSMDVLVVHAQKLAAAAEHLLNNIDGGRDA
jgi:hypothetical protein